MVKVKSFKEKPRTNQGWIMEDFVFESDIFKYIKDDKTVLEEYPRKLASETNYPPLNMKAFGNVWITLG